MQSAVPHSILILKKLPIAESLLLAVAFFWGTSYGLTKDALIYTSILGFLVVRFGLSSLMLLPVFIREKKHGRTKDWQYALPTGAILLSIFLAETYGVFYTTAFKAAFLISLCVLMTPFVDALFKRTRPDPRMILLALLSVIGVLLLTWKDGERLALTLGDYLILLAALLRAFMVVVTNTLLKGKQLSSIATTSIQSNIVAIGALIILLASHHSISDLLPPSLSFWCYALYLSFFCTVFAFFAQNYGVKHTTPSRVALLTGSEPVFGALFAVVWLDESLSLLQVAGCGCIFLAALTASRRV